MATRKDLRAALKAATKAHALIEKAGEASDDEATQSILSDLESAAQTAVDELQEQLDDLDDA